MGMNNLPALDAMEALLLLFQRAMDPNDLGWPMEYFLYNYQAMRERRPAGHPDYSDAACDAASQLQRLTPENQDRVLIHFYDHVFFKHPAFALLAKGRVHGPLPLSSSYTKIALVGG